MAEGALAQRPQPAHGACGEIADAEGAVSARGMQPGHPDNQTGEKIAASVDPQGQRS